MGREDCVWVNRYRMAAQGADERTIAVRYYYYWLSEDSADTSGLKQEKIDVVSPAAIRELPPLVTSGLSFTSVQSAGAHWLAEAVHAFGISRMKRML